MSIQREINAYMKNLGFEPEGRGIIKPFEWASGKGFIKHINDDFSLYVSVKKERNYTVITECGGITHHTATGRSRMDLCIEIILRKDIEKRFGGGSDCPLYDLSDIAPNDKAEWLITDEPDVKERIAKSIEEAFFKYVYSPLFNEKCNIYDFMRMLDIKRYGEIIHDEYKASE